MNSQTCIFSSTPNQRCWHSIFLCLPKPHLMLESLNLSIKKDHKSHLIQNSIHCRNSYYNCYRKWSLNSAWTLLEMETSSPLTNLCMVQWLESSSLLWMETCCSIIFTVQLWLYPLKLSAEKIVSSFYRQPFKGLENSHFKYIPSEASSVV